MQASRTGKKIKMCTKACGVMELGRWFTSNSSQISLGFEGLYKYMGWGFLY